MTFAEAAAICEGLEGVEEEPEADAEELRRLATWARVFGPRSGVHGETDLAVVLDGTERLFGDLNVVLDRAEETLNRLGYTARLAIAPSFLAASALARHGPNRSLLRDPSRLHAALAGLPVLALRLKPETGRWLRELGLDVIGPLLAAPRTDLIERFPDLAERLRALESKDEDPDWTPVQEPERYEERLDFDLGLVRTDSLKAALARLVDRLLARLETVPGGRAVRRLSLVLGDEEPQLIGLRDPTRDPQRILDRITARLEGARLRSRIETLRLAVVEADEPTPKHLRLFEPAEPRRDLDALLDRLAAGLGADRVCRAVLIDDHRPERRVRLLPHDHDGFGITGLVRRDPGDPARPLRLHHRPRRIRVDSRAGHPIRVEGRSVLRDIGPERFDMGFHDEPVRRDYYIAAIADAGWRWIFRDLDSRDWFEHGLFD